MYKSHLVIDKDFYKFLLYFVSLFIYSYNLFLFNIICFDVFLSFSLLELFSEKDVSGRKLYTFQTPTKKNSMMLKANQCRTPETPKSFKTLPTLKIVLERVVETNSKNNHLKSDPENIKIKSIIFF